MTISDVKIRILHVQTMSASVILDTQILVELVLKVFYVAIPVPVMYELWTTVFIYLYLFRHSDDNCCMMAIHVLILNQTLRF